MIENPSTGEEVEFEARSPESLVMVSTWTQPGRRALVALAAAAGILVVPVPSRSYWGPQEVREVAAHSDLIVVAHVAGVVAAEGKPTIAFARIQETWKGPVREHLRFIASPSWPCDASEAIEGETVVLFLSRQDPEEPYRIDAAGRGRLPLRDIDGVRYVTIWDDFLLPAGTPMVPGPDPQFSFMQSVEFTRMRDLVRGFLRPE